MRRYTSSARAEPVCTFLIQRDSSCPDSFEPCNRLAKFKTNGHPRCGIHVKVKCDIGAKRVIKQ